MGDIAKREQELAEQLKGSCLEPIAEGVAALVAAFPSFGGPLSAVISGRVTERKFGRVNDALLFLASELEGIEAAVDRDYVSSEEFEDLFDETLPKISRERSEQKRKLYARFLKGSLLHPEITYDEKLRFLDLLDRLQLAHIAVLQALLQEPDEAKMYSGPPGSVMQTMRERLETLSEPVIEELTGQLNAMRLTNVSETRAMMTAHGAQNLRPMVTSPGKRFYDFVFG